MKVQMLLKKFFFTNKIKKRGPGIEPWGTPSVLKFVSDVLLLYTPS